jgi:hypothetical protein
MSFGASAHSHVSTTGTPASSISLRASGVCLRPVSTNASGRRSSIARIWLSSVSDWQRLFGDDQGIPASASASVIPSIVSAKKRMAQRRHDSADESAAPYRQTASEAIGDIADLVHHVPDEVARLWGAPFGVSQHSRARHLRDAHESSNIGHSRVEPDPARSLAASSTRCRRSYGTGGDKIRASAIDTEYRITKISRINAGGRHSRSFRTQMDAIRYRAAGWTYFSARRRQVAHVGQRTLAGRPPDTI